MHPTEQATTLVLAATGRLSTSDALAWIAEGRRLRKEVRTDQLLAAVAELAAESHGAEALRELSRTLLSSAVDPSVDLLGLDEIVRPPAHRAALSEVRAYTASGTLSDITAEAVAAAQANNAQVVATLGLVAGLSWRDLRDRALARTAMMPGDPAGPWNHAQIVAVFDAVNEVITNNGTARLPGATPARPLELFTNSLASWTAIEDLFQNGVTFETLLAQRDVGGAWLSHRQSTTRRVAALIADDVCRALNEAGVAYLRAAALGGDTSKQHLREILGGEPGQTAVVGVDAHGDATIAIAISVARDGGTARKNGGRLRTLPTQFDTPAAAVVVGPGWADRGESTELVAAFTGRVFTELTMTDLAATAAALSTAE